ncbi:lignostilbene-alpha,beta-dioxygenase-like enzyme [Leptolyngbyaceae cyanobacterium JSC-12]|nr:lignostilbene-alpha,beta-dioxygenase-like enzyme [Leptolyngbyaceae cyanobacterium JSC-12]
MTSTLNPAIASETPYNRDEWQRGYRSLKQEFDYWIDDIEGEIPAGLNGTLFRNGPGLLDVNGQPIHHPFDGDGMVCAIAFQQGRAHFRNRYIQTEGYLAEQKAGKILYRGVFGTDKPGGWLANVFDLKLKNIANTNILYWGGKLLALWEAAEPYRLEPATLETLGLEYLDGLLQPGDAFGAHPWIDPACEQQGGMPCLLNFAIKPGVSSKITVYELTVDGKLFRQNSATVPGFCFIHDFAITPNYSIFFQNPVTFNPIPFLIGFRSAGECIQFHPKRATKIVLIPRYPKANHQAAPNQQPSLAVPDSRSSVPVIVETHAGFVFHHANAFEDGDEVVIDSICYESLPAVEPDADFRQTNFETLKPGQLWRFRVNLQTGKIQRCMIDERCVEFPAVHPAKVGRSHRYLYFAAAHAPTGNAPNQAILKMDVETGDRILWSAAPWGYVGEPVFVPRHPNPYQLAGAEDDGWILTLVFDARSDRSAIVILDARDLRQIARLNLTHHVPYGLHGSFTPECFI